MKIKVCGMREPENIREIADLKPDYMGFIFYSLSKRYAGEMDPAIADKIPPEINKTGVFVDADLNEILRFVKKYKLDAVQLHGVEPADLCIELKEQGLEVIKAFGIDSIFDFSVMKKYEGAADHFLLDTKTSGHGGSGKTFDWELLKQYPYNTSYFLSGGLSNDNLKETEGIEDERLYALDLNSRFEISAAIKNVQEVKTAINYIRSKHK